MRWVVVFCVMRPPPPPPPPPPPTSPCVAATSGPLIKNGGWSWVGKMQGAQSTKRMEPTAMPLFEAFPQFVCECVSVLVVVVWYGNKLR